MLGWVGPGDGGRMEQPAAGRPVDQDQAEQWDQPADGRQGLQDGQRQDRSPGLEAALRQHWPANATAQAEALHRLLTIDDRQWHALKGQPCRRAAEQLAGALVQLLAGAGPTADLSSDGRQRAIALTRSALGWLEGDLRDPGCPSHGR